ncbi:hypothetical protein [Roseateles asaccharophilus]|uniref:Uncharacterized protein n=1 Tax=Roseateles asaccharophilus TaxID=582607 RepID=A0ABU2AFK1_9BURK|nr:hypothetical protein [Roseateles asaccharophilus]MDR7335981.1 hypothetical protein [Roseateles asaccharophilus]
MNAARTASFIQHLPRWIAMPAWKAADRERERREAVDRRRALDFLCGVEVRESSVDEWQDTVAAFAAR